MDINHLMRPGTLFLQSLPPLSLYIHLPWCIKKCPYCDFNSHEFQSNNAAESLDIQERYCNALIHDLQASLPLIWGRSVQSVFIGGGTPSLFEPQVIGRLISQIRSMLRLSAGCEITLEANPGTFERERFKNFRQAGVTRLSLGVQSFNDQALGAIGRVHDSAQAKLAAAEAADVFETFNIDLMYALPNQTVDDLKRDLETAFGFSPPHLSIYHLTLEPNTFFAKYPPKSLPSEDAAYEMLDTIVQFAAEQGLERYEVSAFAREGHRCKHNLNYWQFGDYLGIGAGAHSKLSFAHRIIRQVRHRAPELYLNHAERSVAQETNGAIAQSYEVKRGELPFEFMVNLTRLKHGFETEMFSERTGLPLSCIESALQIAISKGLLARNINHLTPTPLGFDFLSDLQTLFLADSN
jgi:oxygen-independent coproporphyrinogen-3 oxidase